jgi:PmbA protein
MTTNEKYALADQVIDHAIKGGARQVSVSIDESRSNNIEIRNKQIDKLTESNRNSLNIELYVDKKYSAASTNRLKKEDLFKFVDEAIASTRFLAEDEFRKLPEPELYYKGGGTDPGILDTSLDSVDARTKIDMANQVQDEAYGKDERIISVSSNYSDSISNRVLVTSNGFRGDNAHSRISLSATVSLKSATGRPDDYWYENSVFMNKLIKTGIGTKALERVVKKLDPKKVNSGKYPMVVENRVAMNLFGALYGALQGYSLYQKESFLIGKLDKPVASKLLTVIDDPEIISAPGSRLFDYEGLSATKRQVIEEGVLRNFYIDTYYGRKLGMKPTSGSSSNVIFKLGTRDMAAMVSGLKKGILVTGFIGGNCNGSTGDFSYGIEGFLVENGKIVHPVNEMNITGNMNHVFFNLAEVGNDFREGSSFRIPSMLFENIDFSGI